MAGPGRKRVRAVVSPCEVRRADVVGVGAGDFEVDDGDGGGVEADVADGDLAAVCCEEDVAVANVLGEDPAAAVDEPLVAGGGGDAGFGAVNADGGGRGVGGRAPGEGEASSAVLR